MTLQAFIEQEIEMNLQTLNGMNNAKILGKKGMDRVQWASKYVSTFRSVYKINYFIKFLVDLMKALLESKSASLAECMGLSFSINLESHLDGQAKKAFN